MYYSNNIVIQKKGGVRFMSGKEKFMEYAKHRLEIKEQRRKEGERAADGHVAETCRRIDKRLACERRRRGYKW